jgi:uncharacterized protein (DUF934 family)
LHYLQRCGFDSFQFDDDIRLEDALSHLNFRGSPYSAWCLPSLTLFPIRQPTQR